MKNNYTLVVGCLFLLSSDVSILLSQTGPEFLDCNPNPTSWCVTDEGVSLPPNNKFYLGDQNPNATSCSVHLTQKTRVRSTCGTSFQYEVQIIMYDTSAPYVLQPLTTVVTDSLYEAELIFDSALSPEDFIRENGLPYTTGCERYHRVRWIVTDSCGEVFICDRLIDLYDCVVPVDSLNSKLFIIEFGCAQEGYIKLQDLIQYKKDDCSSHTELLYSFYSDHYISDSTLYLCEVPALGVEIPIEIWIADNGRDLNCDGFVEWVEKNVYQRQIWVVFTDNGCAPCEPEKNWPAIWGKIETEDRQPVAKAQVSLTSPGHVLPTYITLEDGEYQFGPMSGVFLPPNFTMKVIRDDNHKNGVSTLDLVKIHKHLLGIEIIASPYDLIAADANNSKNVSAIDMVELRKLILNIYSELPNSDSWRFVPKDFIFSDTTHPWPFHAEIDVVNITTGKRVDFIAIKVGDLNNTVQPNVHYMEVRSGPETINFVVEQQAYLANELIEIDFSIDNAQMIQGFQFTISSADLEFIDITSDMIEIGEENFALFEDNLTLSWFDEKGALLSHGDRIFTLFARAKSEGSLKQNFTLNSDITEAEVYSMNEEILDPQLVFIEKENATILHTLQPNPWKQQTSIPFYLQTSGLVTFEIYDLNGRPIYTLAKNFDTGNNVIEIQAADFNSRGILYYSFKSGEMILTGKMIVLE